MEKFYPKEQAAPQMTRGMAGESREAAGEQEQGNCREAGPDSPGSAAGGFTGKAFHRAGDLAARRKAKKEKKKGKKAAKRLNRKIRQHTPRLHFTDEERGDPFLSPSIRRAEKAAGRLETRQKKIPKQKRIRAARHFDERTGRARVKLCMEKTDRPPKNRPHSNPARRPLRETAIALHGKVHEVEKENAGVEGAHKTEKAAEQAAAYVRQKFRQGRQRKRMKPYRKAVKAEKALKKANTRFLYQKSAREHPELVKTPLSRLYQKRRIKRQYAKELRQQARAAKKAAGRMRRTASLLARHWKGAALLGLALSALILLFSGLSSCASLFEGALSGLLGTSYTAGDSAIKETEADYKALETGLNGRIGRTEADYPGYDEYRYHLDETGHDPFALASFLTAKLDDYTRAEAQTVIRELFQKQYTLSYREETETRTRTEPVADPETGEETGETVEVTYEYHILHVTLANREISQLAALLLTPEQKEMFAIYMETKGNRPELFGGSIYQPAPGGEYLDYDPPPAALSDGRFAAMIAEAEKYLGYPYVWGGSSPATSFDCSGFVCYVINQSGAGNVGRTTAQGLFNYTAALPSEEARPGDLIFFTGTYGSGGAVSHVGIYVGNSMMIHCGNPISYASVNTPYWRQHFYSYGRLP